MVRGALDVDFYGAELIEVSRASVARLLRLGSTAQAPSNLLRNHSTPARGGVGKKNVFSPQVRLKLLNRDFLAVPSDVSALKTAPILREFALRYG